MPIHNDDDLLRNTVMTFGQHLGELRVCLWRAILGLGVGFLLGLAIGQYVVRFIEMPLTNALQKFYETQTEVKLHQQFGDQIPPEQLRNIQERHMVFDEVYVEPRALMHSLRERFPEQFPQAAPQEDAGGASAPAAPSAPTAPGASAVVAPEDLLPLKVWRKSAEVTQIVGMNPLEAFMVYMKASLLVGVVISSPWVFYQLWTFVAAGLYRRERQYVRVFLPFSLALFIGGVLLAFFAVFPIVLKFLFQFNAWLGIGITPRISEWLSFVLLMPLAFGISFQLPLVMLFLERIGVFTVESYLSQWRIAVLAIFVLAMILSPSPDPQSMLLMAVPLVLLYFGGIELCRRWPRAGARSK